MKKTIVLLFSFALAACHCQRACPRAESNPQAEITVTAPAPVPPAAGAPTKPQADALLSDEPAAKKLPQPVKTTLPTAADIPPTPTPAITKQPLSTKQTAPAHPQAPAVTDEPTIQDPQAKLAQQLIAQNRANQTLTHVPADFPSFKKEELLSPVDRLLNPLAYEPLLPDSTQAPWSNESLQYGIYYSFVKAGTAYIKSRGIVQKDGKTAYLIQTTALSASVIDSVYRVRDINYSWIDTTTLHSLGYSQSLREGNYQRDEWVRFDRENGRFYGETKKKKEAYYFVEELDQEVLDVLSSLYFVRAQSLEVGKDIVFDIVNRGKKYPLVVKVLGKETVKTAAGKFNCWLLEPQLRGESIFVVKGKSLKVWLTDDKYRMPVKMSVEVFIGSVSAELLAYQRN